MGDARPIPSFEGSPTSALEIVAVAGLGLDLSPLPNRTTSAFDFRRHQSEYAPTAVAIKPKTLIADHRRLDEPTQFRYTQVTGAAGKGIQAARPCDKRPMLALRPSPRRGGQMTENQPALRRQTRVASRSITVVRRPNGSGVTPRIQSSTRATSIVTNMALDRSGPSGK
jgi:hypothetical protein